MNLRVGRPSFAGTLPFLVGKSRYGLPPGSRIAHAQGKPLAYVLAPDGSVHVFTESGEVFGIPEPLAELVRARFFPPPG